jgi:hypothetical protein
LSGRIYSLAQCWRDLSPTNCGSWSETFSGQEGALRSQLGSMNCYLRSEIYEFFNASNLRASPVSGIFLAHFTMIRNMLVLQGLHFSELNDRQFAEISCANSQRGKMGAFACRHCRQEKALQYPVYLFIQFRMKMNILVLQRFRFAEITHSQFTLNSCENLQKPKDLRFLGRIWA